MATAYYLQTAIGWEEMPEDVVAKIEAGRNAGSTIVPVHAFGDSMEIRFGADAKLGPAMQAKTGIVQVRFTTRLKLFFLCVVRKSSRPLTPLPFLHP